MDIDNFLLAHPENVVVVHCLAGKGRTGTVIICYLLYSGLFNDPIETALFFANRRSVNNWGVTGPSQQRYIKYFHDILTTQRIPDHHPLKLVSIAIHNPPMFSLGGRKSFTPIITVVDVSGGLVQYTKWTSKGDSTIYDDTDHIVFEPDNLILKGDMNVTVVHLGTLGRKQKVARFAYNTGMLQMLSNGMYVTRFTKSDIDDACNDKRTPHSFYIELRFKKIDDADIEEKPEIAQMWKNVFANYDKDSDGRKCFNLNSSNIEERIQLARQSVDLKSGRNLERGGYLTKRGHRIKNWKRRWFVLHSNTLEYYKSPKNSSPCGVIPLDDIVAIQQLDNDTLSDVNIPNSFVIYTNWNDYVCYADNESEMEEWIDALTMATKIKEKKELSTAALGQLTIKVLEIIKGKTDFYCIFDFGGGQKFKTELISGATKEIVVDIYPHNKSTLRIELWEEKSYFINQNIAWCEDTIQEIIDNTLTFPLENDQWYDFKRFGAKIHVKMTYRPRLWLESQSEREALSEGKMVVRDHGRVTAPLAEHEIAELIQLMDERILLMSVDPDLPIKRQQEGTPMKYRAM